MASTVERDGTVGGDGAADSWSFTYVQNGVTWTYYAYPVNLAERLGLDDDEAAERFGDRLWDVETVDMSEDDVSEYEYRSLNGYVTLEEADAAARAEAERVRGIVEWLETTNNETKEV